MHGVKSLILCSYSGHQSGKKLSLPHPNNKNFPNRYFFRKFVAPFELAILQNKLYYKAVRYCYITCRRSCHMTVYAVRLPGSYPATAIVGKNMAVVGRQVRVAASEDAVIAVQRDVIVDPQLGRAVEVERVAVAVDTGDGRIAVAEQQRIVGVATQVRAF